MMNIKIDGSEKNKNEIIYNNIIETMNEMELSKDEQLDYLKQKITFLESEVRNRLVLFFTILVGAGLLGFGLYLMFIHESILGAIVIIFAFGFTTAQLLFRLRKVQMIYQSNRFDQVEQLRKMLNIRLK